MAVYPPGVSERVFEFAFNSEFCTTSGALIAGCPYIPTQNQEKRLGYDVAIKIGGGSRIRSLYLQHKVARRVDGKSGSNKRFRDVVGSPYYAFSLDVDQYNLIHRFSQKKTREFYYCAPIFTSRQDLNGHFSARTVVPNAAWIDISTWSTIPSTDTQAHCIVYSPDLTAVSRFSEEPEKPISGERPSPEKFFNAPALEFRTEDMAKEYFDFFDTLKEWWPERSKTRRKSEEEDGFRMKSVLPPRREDFKQPRQVVEAIQEITGDYLGVTWLVKVNA
ncbi:MAG: hypothetical protein M9951_08875 [Burkholderiaceae bacterium]|nr:hypothetical protein [Burkholderiaceae bacterium]